MPVIYPSYQGLFSGISQVDVRPDKVYISTRIPTTALMLPCCFCLQPWEGFVSNLRFVMGFPWALPIFLPQLCQPVSQYS